MTFKPFFKNLLFLLTLLLLSSTFLVAAPNQRLKLKPKKQKTQKLKVKPAKKKGKLKAKKKTNQNTSVTTNTATGQQAPGLDTIGYGYNVFGMYADPNSKKRYQLFKFTNKRDVPIGSKTYAVPEQLILENISKHIIKTVSGSSLRQYAKNQSASVGLRTKTLFFSGSINQSYSSSSSGSKEYYYHTYRDANIKWRISVDERSMQELKNILDPQFKKDVNTMNPTRLFELYGTHYIASAYLGGRADFTSISEVSSSTNTMNLSTAIQAKYKMVSGSANLSYAQKNLLRTSKTTTKLIVTGGKSEYANNIHDAATYAKWAEGIDPMPVLADFDAQSLRPIWEFASTPARQAELEAEFKKWCKRYPLPKAMSGALKMSNQIYYVKPVSNKYLYIDIPGYHFNAKRKPGTRVTLYEKDNVENGLQGIDRFIKVVPHATKPEYVYLQPQHSDLVFDIAGGSKKKGAELQLWNKGNNNGAQMFEMIKVDGKTNTYYLKNKRSGLYLTANKKRPITQDILKESKRQQWEFIRANGETEMATIPAEIYSMQNVKSGKYMDISGSAGNQQHKGAKLQLWSMDEAPDRYMLLMKSSRPNHFYVKPQHGNHVWDVRGGKKRNGTELILWDKHNGKNQEFKFIYAGDAMTFFILNTYGKAVDASDNQIGRNGCPIIFYDLHKRDNQKWKLRYVKKWQMPKRSQKFFIRSAYKNKYLDVDGKPNSNNKNGKKFLMKNFDEDPDKHFKFIPSGDHSWVKVQVQNGGKMLSVPDNSNSKGKRLTLWEDHRSDAIKFAVEFTSPTTFVLRTHNWKAMDVAGKNKIKQWNVHYGNNQQFQLIYADGYKKGKVYNFLKDGK